MTTFLLITGRARATIDNSIGKSEKQP